MFNVSDKVICVDFQPRPPAPGRVYATKVPKGGTLVSPGMVYVIRRCWTSVLSGDLLISLVGIPDFYNEQGLLIGFTADRFRKLQEIQAKSTTEVALA